MGGAGGATEGNDAVFERKDAVGLGAVDVGFCFCCCFNCFRRALASSWRFFDAFPESSSANIVKV